MYAYLPPLPLPPVPNFVEPAEMSCARGNRGLHLYKIAPLLSSLILGTDHPEILTGKPPPLRGQEGMRRVARGGGGTYGHAAADYQYLYGLSKVDLMYFTLSSRHIYIFWSTSQRLSQLFRQWLFLSLLSGHIQTPNIPCGRPQPP